MRRHSYLLFPLFASVLFAQTAPKTDTGPAATFESNVRVVLLDVVVTDKSGAPVTGLTEDDFRVFEDGKPQKISSFKEHAGVPMKLADMPKLPENTYSNYASVENADSINVILLDALNTETTDQEFVHQQVIKYLKTIPPGARVAVFTLTSRLRMVQEFTTDSSRLLAAVNDPRLVSPHASGLLKSKKEDESDQQIIENAKLNQVGPVRDMTGVEEAVDPVNVLKELLAEKTLGITSQRVGLTIDAFQQLAHYLSGFPGRKNVIWVSSSFPLVLFAEADLPNPSLTLRTFTMDLQKTADMCTAAQISIYPVLAEGLANSSVYEAGSQAISQERPSMMNQNNIAQMNREFGNRAGSRLAMEDLARNTGGQAFFDSNGLGAVLTRVTSQGMHYYTLSYTPTNTKMDGRYRQTRVEIGKGKYKLSYRRGYHAIDNKIGLATDGPQNPLLPLMGFGLPDISQLVYKVSVDPRENRPADAPANGAAHLKGPTRTYAFNFGISLYQMKLERLPDGNRRAHLEVRVIAYDDAGKPLNMTGHSGYLNLTPMGYQEALKTGVQLHEELDLPAKTSVHVRTGVFDLNSDNAGTLGIRLWTVAGK